MLSKTIEKALNGQLKTEAQSSHYYLAMASWAENKGYPGIAEFMYQHSDEGAPAHAQVGEVHQ
jgi:ferritin